MALGPTHLADKSALARHPRPEVGERLEELIEGGLLATCTIVELEVLFSARSPADYRALRRERGLAFARVAIDQAVLDRAEEVQGLLAEEGKHRAAAIPDLIIAAAAELAGLTVLHYDPDFDAIGAVTGQAMEWVAPRGSVA